MSWATPPRLVRRLHRLSVALQHELLSDMSAEDLLRLDADFEMWANDGQIEPLRDGWRTWLMLAGRGYGKTRAGAEWVHRLALGKPVRIALVAANLDEARAVMVEGASGVLSVARRRGCRVKWEPSLKRLTWPGGSVAELYSGDNGEGLRGPEHEFAWCDELAKWREPEATWDNLQMGLRGGARPRSLVTTTPRSIALLTRLRKERWTVETGGRTADNVNLSQQFIEVMIETYGKTRLGRQELEGELIADAEGALWPRALIEKCRAGVPAALDRIVVGVDPPAGSGAGCDACGIVVAARAGERYYVLADESVAGLSPEGWARAVAAAAARWSADRVVAEANNGGEMVASCLKAADAGLTPVLVHASKGKVARAEPVALRFEAGTAFFAGVFPELEDELAGLAVGGAYLGPGRSPDRADAMVWAMHELSERRGRVPRLIQL